MVLEAAYGRNRSIHSGTIFIFTVMALVLFHSIGKVDAQEVRSGWDIVDSGTEDGLISAEFYEGGLWAFGTNGTMIVSVDGGLTWSSSGIAANEGLTASDSNFGAMVVAGEAGTILLKNEGVWADLSHSSLGDIADIALTGNDSFVVLTGSEIWKFQILDGGGHNWEAVGGISEGRLLSVSFLDSENGLASGDNGIILASTDGGETWGHREVPDQTSEYSIIDIEYYSNLRAYAISEQGHILVSSSNEGVQVGYVWNLRVIERIYPPGGIGNYTPGGDSIGVELTSIEVLSQTKIMLSGPNGYLALSKDEGNRIYQQMIPLPNSTVFHDFAMIDKFGGIAVGSGGVAMLTDNAGEEEMIGFEVIDFNDFGQFVDYSKERILDGLKATAKIVIFGIAMGFSIGIFLSMLKTSPTTLKNIVQTNRFQLLTLAIMPIWVIFQIPRIVTRGFVENPANKLLNICRERSARVAATEPLNLMAIRATGSLLILSGVLLIYNNLDNIRDLNLDGWEHIYSPIGAPSSVAQILVGIGVSILGAIFVSCNGDFSIKNMDIGPSSVKFNPWGIRPLNTLATAYTDIFRNTPLLVQFLFVHFGFELGRRLQDPGLLLFSFESLEENANFLTNIIVVYDTNPDSLAYGRPVGGVLSDRAYISAIFALGLNSGAYQCETIRGAIAAIPSGQMEAGRSIGLNYMQSMRLVIMPQAVRICIPPLGNEMVNLVLNSSLAMIIGYAEVTRQGKLIVATTFQVFWTWGMVLISYFLITWTLALLLRYLEEKTRIPGLGISGGA